MTRTSQSVSSVIASNLAEMTNPSAIFVLPMPGVPMISSTLPCASPTRLPDEAGDSNASKAGQFDEKRAARRDDLRRADADCDGAGDGSD
jgi:hypothetical protein